MARKTGIAWTHSTFNPWRGCTVVSEACVRCYARDQIERQAKGSIVWGQKGTRVKTSAANWEDPVKWNREAAARGKPHLVFCSSLADVFESHPSIRQDWRDQLWALIRATPYLTWQLLTKRPSRIRQYLPADWGDGYSNVWLGTTVENQRWADIRIPQLLSVPAKVHFLSCEPLLGPLDLTRYLGRAATHSSPNSDKKFTKGIDWVIVGGEKTAMGEGARPMSAAWVRGLRDQCAASRPRAAFFFKQWGNFDAGGVEVGADKAGFELDGRIHHDFPRPPGSKGRGRPRRIDSLPADDPRYMADRLASGRARKALDALSPTDREWVEGIAEKVKDANPTRRGDLLRAIRKVLSRTLVDPASPLHSGIRAADAD